MYFRCRWPRIASNIEKKKEKFKYLMTKWKFLLHLVFPKKWCKVILFELIQRFHIDFDSCESCYRAILYQSNGMVAYLSRKIPRITNGLCKKKRECRRWNNCFWFEGVNLSKKIKVRTDKLNIFWYTINFEKMLIDGKRQYNNSK